MCCVRPTRAKQASHRSRSLKPPVIFSRAMRRGVWTPRLFVGSGPVRRGRTGPESAGAIEHGPARMTKPPERVRTGADLDADALTATDCRCRSRRRRFSAGPGSQQAPARKLVRGPRARDRRTSARAVAAVRHPRHGRAGVDRAAAGPVRQSITSAERRRWRTSAARPLTCAAEKELPLTRNQRPPGSVVGTSRPGAV